MGLCNSFWRLILFAVFLVLSVSQSNAASGPTKRLAMISLSDAVGDQNVYWEYSYESRKATLILEDGARLQPLSVHGVEGAVLKQFDLVNGEDGTTYLISTWWHDIATTSASNFYVEVASIEHSKTLFGAWSLEMPTFQDENKDGYLDLVVTRDILLADLPGAAGWPLVITFRAVPEFEELSLFPDVVRRALERIVAYRDNKLELCAKWQEVDPCPYFRRQDRVDLQISVLRQIAEQK